MQLAATFGDPVETKKINAGVNLPSDAPVIAADVELMQTTQKLILHRHR